jgi:hypothetical protein
MTANQLDLLDQYALNLKEGRNEFPQIDKSQREMQLEIVKLRGQIEILQNRGVIPQATGKPQQEQDRLSVQDFSRLEDQIKKMIAPLREDFSKMSEMGRPQYVGGQSVAEGPQFRPPMPLPIAHNDWSQIKEGFSYMYNSKIPIDLKGVQDEAGFNLVKARYEFAALQLQNMESLKLLKEKQTVEDRLAKEVS